MVRVHRLPQIAEARRVKMDKKTPVAYGDEVGVQIGTADGVFGACTCPEDNGRPTMGGVAEGAGPDSSGNSSQSAADTTDGEQDELNSPDTPGSGSSSADEMPCRQDTECPADQFCALSDGLGAGMHVRMQGRR